ncbi:putative WRKY transcription factor 61 [Forsythia ovata]|uniref:WRKY transcription factor 61 n=1 Tax=Forsythia ovata TaxID=205694 RepID=A0ABD1WHR7_9LAMI
MAEKGPEWTGFGMLTSHVFGLKTCWVFGPNEIFHGVYYEKIGFGGEVKEENKGCEEDDVLQVGNGKGDHGYDSLKPSSVDQKNLSKKVSSSSAEPDSMAPSSTKKEQDDHQLELVKAEMGEVNEENQRLKMRLDRILKDYRTLQMQYQDVVQQETVKKSTGSVQDTEEESAELLPQPRNEFK